jgi:hypothetical protein
MLRRVILVTTDVSEERIASIIIGELGTRQQQLAPEARIDCHHGEGGTFLRFVGSYNSHTAVKFCVSCEVRAEFLHIICPPLL